MGVNDEGKTNLGKRKLIYWQLFRGVVKGEDAMSGSQEIHPRFPKGVLDLKKSQHEKLNVISRNNNFVLCRVWLHLSR